MLCSVTVSEKKKTNPKKRPVGSVGGTSMHAVFRCLLPILALAIAAGATRVTSETFQDLAAGKNVILKAHAPW